MKFFRTSMLLLCVLLFLINLSGIEPKKNSNKKSKFRFTILRDIIRTDKDLYTIIQRILTNPKGMKEVWNELVAWLGDDTDDIEVIKDKLTAISSQLNWIMIRMDAKFSTTEKMLNQLPLTIDIDRIKEELTLTIRRIKDLYGEALKYSADIDRYNGFELKNFANTLTGMESGDLRESLARLYGYIVPSTATNLKRSFLDFLNHHVQGKRDTLCGHVQPLSQYMYHLYEVIMSTEMMGQVALAFGYYLQNKLTNVNTDSELQLAQEEHQTRLTSYFRKFKQGIQQASVVLRPCDPSSLIRGDTYIEMERLYQKILTEDYNVMCYRSCKGSCSDINVHNFKHASDEFRCGHMWECDHVVTARYCVQPNELRRYQWFQENITNIFYGDGNSCRGNEYRTEGWNLTGEACETCICTCRGNHNDYDHSQGIFAINMEWSHSDYDDNKVVTGLRFAVCNTEVSILIKQGKVLPGGEIEENSESWTSCSDNSHVWETSDLGLQNRIDQKFRVVVESNNHINLDDVVTKERNAVVTGAKFGIDYEPDGEHIKIRLEYRKFNFTTGKLGGIFEDRWSTARHRTRANKPNTDSAFFQKREDKNIPHPTGSSYVAFGTSNFKRDAGQTTIPFWDAQPVESNPSAPLSGVGLFYKSSPGYAGFLGLRIHTINYGKFMEEGVTFEEESTVQSPSVN